MNQPLQRTAGGGFAEMIGNASIVERARMRLSAILMRIFLRYLPEQPAILSYLGTIELILENYVKAEKLLARSADVEPNKPDTWFRRAIALERLDRRGEAIQCYSHAMSLRPGFEEAIEARRDLIARTGGPQANVQRGKSATSVKSRDPKACVDRGSELFAERRWAEALAYFDRAIALKPDYPLAHNNRGSVLHQLKRHEESLLSYQQALAIDPGFGEAERNRASVLSTMNRIDEAVAGFDRAIKIDASDAKAWYGRGNALMHSNRIPEAIASYDRAIALVPGHVSAHWNKSLCELLAGNLDEGLRLHEWRWRKFATDPNTAAGVSWPLWLGKAPLEGKSILLVHEQGLGDFIQFSRYVPKLRARGARVVIAAPGPLLPLLATLGDIGLVERGKPPPECDYLCAITSLPLAFGTTLETIPAEVPYLAVPEGYKKAWKDQLGRRSRPRIGLAWSGSAAHGNDHNRSIALKTLEPLLQLPVDFHVLQRDLRAGDAELIGKFPNARIHAEQLQDFGDASALTAEMDLVISVDTASAHLAGALGKPTWILLPWAPDWRWMLGRSDSPWYPTVRLFRQSKYGDWSGVIEGVAAELSKSIQSIGQ